ncbi:hypothetical protein [Salinicola sp. CR57]|uniref:hypothetical protein n=1 Tax=Salinicola sp. CR57 TaxID=1949086 RepID=UPI000DA1CADE|nr:hypothetical protein [Salinicola sp. CR57]
MHFTEPQKRLLDCMRTTGQKVNFFRGGGWRLFDGSKVHHRTVESLASRGYLMPAANDLFGGDVTAYQLSDEAA